jgi:uncharacterized protein
VIAYFDTSALIPLLVEESGSEVASRLWGQADHVVSVRLIYAEARAALAQARRGGRLDPAAADASLAQLEHLYQQLDRIEVDDDLVRRAGALADELDLRGYDAVHLAAVERVAGDRTVLLTGDGDLLRAAPRLGIAVTSTAG